jgi:beta-lactamase class A
MRSVVLFFAAASLVFGATDPSLARLERQIENVSLATDGVVGVAAFHMETGRAVSVHGAEAFPMASAFKLPIAVQILTLVDEGKLTLDKMEAIAPSDLHPGSGRLTDLFFHPGLSISIANLLELAIVISDNSAADILLREAGGPAAVTARMKALGLNKIRVDRSTAQLLADWGGVTNLPSESQWTKGMWDPLFNAVSERDHMTARRAQTKDPRDTATPDDMTELMTQIWRRGILSAESSSLLLAIMDRCETGKGRIKGMLPVNTDVAHKTGSVGGVANDVGIITLPGGAGHVALSVFTKGSGRPEDASEKAIAEISRTIYDYFVLVPAVPGASR